MEEDKFMLLAIEEATSGMKASEGGPFGAVIVKDGKVMSKAHNTVLKEKDPTRHAEMNAISLAAKVLDNYDLSGCEIYTTTEPCPMCFSAVHWSKIDKVIYGTTIEDVKKLGFNELTIPAEHMKEVGLSPVEIVGGFLREECRVLLEAWAMMPDKEVY